MSNYDVEKRLAEAMQHATPDVLDEILSRCEQKGIEPMKETKKGKKLFLAIGAAAAALAIAVGGLAGFSAAAKNKVDSVIAFDVNPSIRLEVNAEERILRAEALNADGNAVLDDMDLKNTELDVAVYAIIGSMVKNGYISELQNSILITVENEDAAKGAALEKKLNDEVSSILDANAIPGAVLTQTTTTETEEVKNLAAAHNISTGKAALVETIAAQDPTRKADDLAELSVTELTLLANGAAIEGVTQTGTASDKAYIGYSKAKEIAFAHAGVRAEEVRGLEIDLDYEKSRMLYELEFDANGREYEYDIDAVSGEIVKHKNHADDDYRPAADKQSAATPEPVQQPASAPDQQSGQSGRIGSARAKEIAFAHAGVTDPYDVEVELEQGVYEVDFEQDGVDYEYRVDAYTGEVVRSSDKAEKNGSSSAAAARISADKAKQAALDHAGISSPRDLDVEYESGNNTYEVDFDANGLEYEYIIDAESGDVVRHRSERDD